MERKRAGDFLHLWTWFGREYERICYPSWLPFETTTAFMNNGQHCFDDVLRKFPKYSLNNLNNDELPYAFYVDMNAGDLLYIPRGYWHGTIALSPISLSLNQFTGVGENSRVYVAIR